MRKQQQKKNKSPTPRWASAQLATGLARPPSRPTCPPPPPHSPYPPHTANHAHTTPTHSLIPSQPETLARSTTTPPRLLPRFPLDRDRPLHSPLTPRSSRSLPIRIGVQRRPLAAAPLRPPPLPDSSAPLLSPPSTGSGQRPAAHLGGRLPSPPPGWRPSPSPPRRRTMSAGSRRRAPNPATAAPSESPRSDALQRRQAAGHDHHDPFRPPQAPLLLDVSTSHIPT